MISAIAVVSAVDFSAASKKQFSAVDFSAALKTIIHRGTIGAVLKQMECHKNLARKCLERWNAAVSVDEGTNITSANQRSS